MPQDVPISDQRPPLRRRSELRAALQPQAGAGEPQWDDVQICLVAGPKDHGPQEHDYPWWQAQWERLLHSAPGVVVSTAHRWPSQEQLAAADVIVLYFWNHDWSEEQYAGLDAQLARGGGVVAIHSAIVEDRDPQKLAERFGLAGRRPELQFRHGPLKLEIADDADAGFAHGLTRLNLVDETYWALTGDPAGVDVVAQAHESGQACPMTWTHRVHEGRVFCSVNGHYTWTFEDPLYRLLLLRGMAWAAGQPTVRWESLAGEGVEFAPE